MKKYLLIPVILLAGLLGLIAKPTNAKSLYNCYQSKKLTWESLSTRAVRAAATGIFYYKGTATQNAQLSSVICSDKLGYSVATGYSTTLSASITSGQSFIPVSSLTLKDLSVLNITTLGGLVFLDLEPGSSKEEIVMCNAINTSTIQFTGCTRGLAFSGTSTSAVSNNQKSHNSGSTIVMSNVHYVYEQFVDINAKNQNIAGVKTFASGTIYITSSSYGFRVLNGMLQWSVDGFANSYNFTSSTISTLTASTTAGININNGQIATVVSSTQGMAFGPDGAIYQKTSSTLAVGSDINGIYIITSTLSSLIATGTPTAGMIPITNASGTLDNWITVTNSLPFVPNTLPTENTYNTYQLVLIPNITPAGAADNTNGWRNFWASTVNADVTLKTANVNSTTFSASARGEYRTPLMGTSSFFANLGGRDFTRVKFRARFTPMVAGQEINIGIATSSFAAGDEAWNTVSTSASFDVSHGAGRFVFTVTGLGMGVNPLLSSVTSDNATVVRNAISGITVSDWNTYEIEYNGTTVSFYVNGVLKFTHSTNTTMTGTAWFGFGNTAAAANSVAFTDPIISQQL